MTNTSNDDLLTFDLVAHQESLGEVAYSLAIQGSDAEQVAEDAGLMPAFLLERAMQRFNITNKDLEFQEVPPDGTPQQVYKIGSITFDLDGDIVAHDSDPSNRKYYHIGKGDTGQTIGPDEPADL